MPTPNQPSDPASSDPRSRDPDRTVVFDWVGRSPYNPPIDDPDRYATPAQSIPGYEFLEHLGQGGMGTVWLARQVSADRLVALKTIRFNGSETDRQRFRVECRVMAQLDHPNIARIFEVGETRDTPWLTMEYCAGGSLEDWADRKPQDPSLCAAVVATLADAVAHAHDAGVIHRDLKPNNVLIRSRRRDSATGPDRLEPPSTLPNPLDHPAPTRPGALDVSTLRITDFGLARRIDEDAERLTETRHGFGTPEYMSPEQFASVRNVGTSTDIWALGVTLYQLLTGTMPFLGRGMMEVSDRVRTDDPVPPSQRVGVPRDLETICLKCLRKDPVARYRTARELADDLEAFAAGRPIRARAVGRLERGIRLMRRNPTLTLMGLAVGLSLVAGTAVSVWQAGLARDREGEAVLAAGREGDARREADRQSALAGKAAEEARAETRRADVLAAAAKRNAKRAIAVNEFFLIDLLGRANALKSPEEIRNKTAGDLTMRRFLEIASERIPDQFRSEPDIELSIRRTMGDAWLSLGDARQAIVHQTRALELAERVEGRDSDVWLEAVNRLGLACYAVGEYDLAGGYFEDAAAGLTRNRGAWDETALLCRLNIATIRARQNRFAEAEAGFESVIPELVCLDGQTHPAVLGARLELASIRTSVGRFREAEEAIREIREVANRELGETHLLSVDTEIALGTVLARRGRFAEAQTHYEKALTDSRGAPDRIELTLAKINLGAIHAGRGRLPQSIALLEEAIPAYERSVGPGHPDLLRHRAELVGIYLKNRQPTEADLLTGRVATDARRAFGHEGPQALELVLLMALKYAHAGDKPRAAALMAEVWETASCVQGIDGPIASRAGTDLGFLRYELGDIAGAEPLLAASVDRYHRLGGADVGTVVGHTLVLIEVQRRLRKFADAEATVKRGLEWLVRIDADHPVRPTMVVLWGLSVADQKRPREAEPILRDGLTRVLMAPGRVDPRSVAASISALIAIERSLGDDASVAEWTWTLEAWRDARRIED